MVLKYFSSVDMWIDPSRVDVVLTEKTTRGAISVMGFVGGTKITLGYVYDNRSEDEKSENDNPFYLDEKADDLISKFLAEYLQFVKEMEEGAVGEIADVMKQWFDVWMQLPVEASNEMVQS